MIQKILKWLFFKALEVLLVVMIYDQVDHRQFKIWNCVMIFVGLFAFMICKLKEAKQKQRRLDGDPYIIGGAKKKFLYNNQHQKAGKY